MYIKHEVKLFLKCVIISNPYYASVTCSKISNIHKNYIFTTKFNFSSILITIISWEYLNLSVENEYVGDVTIPTQVILYNQCFSKQTSQSDCSIHIKINYYLLYLRVQFRFFCTQCLANFKYI